jgi:hypothetical protein
MENTRLIVSLRNFCLFISPPREAARRRERKVFEIKFMIIGLHRRITAAAAAVAVAAGKNGFIA